MNEENEEFKNEDEFDVEFWEDRISEIGSQRQQRALEKVADYLTTFSWKTYSKAVEKGFSKEQAMQLTKLQSTRLMQILFNRTFGNNSGGAEETE